MHERAMLLQAQCCTMSIDKGQAGTACSCNSQSVSLALDAHTRFLDQYNCQQAGTCRSGHQTAMSVMRQRQPRLKTSKRGVNSPGEQRSVIGSQWFDITLTQPGHAACCKCANHHVGDCVPTAAHVALVECLHQVEACKHEPAMLRALLSLHNCTLPAESQHHTQGTAIRRRASPRPRRPRNPQL